MLSSFVGDMPITMLSLLILLLHQPNVLAAGKDANDDAGTLGTEAGFAFPRRGQKFKVNRENSQNNMSYIQVVRTRKLHHNYKTCVSEPPRCDDDSCGDCQTARNEFGCSCPRCQCAVCELDDFCCTYEWDDKCVELAELECGCLPEQLTLPRPTVSPIPTVAPSISPRPTTSSFPTFGDCGDASTCMGQVQCGTCASDRPGEKGCSCPACECEVCSQDPFCCRVSWDHVCVQRAGSLCKCFPEANQNQIEDPSVEPSVEPSEEPSFEPSEQGIGEQRVPEVCLSEPTCQNNSCGDCQTAQNQLGCSCPQCECTVCEIDDFCCSQEWDESCVEIATRDCSCGASVPVTPTVSPRPTVAPTISPRPTTSSFPTFGDCGDASACGTEDGQCGTCASERLDEKGCSCSACECEVCSADPFCCRVAWDQVCADKAGTLCNCIPESNPEPAQEPTAEPSDQESEEPTGERFVEASEQPTAEPSKQDSEEPTVEPSDKESEEPTVQVPT